MSSSTQFHPRKLGAAGPRCFRWRSAAWACRDVRPERRKREHRDDSRRARRRITLLDTGDYYGAGHNELLIGRALRDRRDKALVSVKFGRCADQMELARHRHAAGGDQELPGLHADAAGCRPRRHLPAGTPGSERYRSKTPIGAIAELVKAGLVRAIGLSEVGPDTIRGRTESQRIAMLEAIFQKQ